MMQFAEKADELIGIRPEVTVLSVFKHLNYKPWFAIAEFIDNSLESYLNNESALKAQHGDNFQLVVDISIENSGLGQIIISDNAGGIAESDFPRAFRAAQAPDDRNGLSEFGMGMKSAACWFAKTWSVRTKALNEGIERAIYFDVDDIVVNKRESLSVELRQVSPSYHYTVVSLRGLHHSLLGRTLAKIRSHLASIYRVFLRNGTLLLKLNGEELQYVSPKILKAVHYRESDSGIGIGSEPVEWRKDIDLDFGNGQRVTGFAALRDVGSTYFAGFALFRRGRLIVGSHDETYRPSYIFKQTTSYAYQRVFGELHFEGFEVSHTKDGFRWEQYEDIFLEFLKEALEEEPLNLLAQAENFRALPSKKTIEAQAIAATLSVSSYLKNEFEPLLREIRVHPPNVPVLPEGIDSSTLQASESTVAIEDGGYRWLVTLRTSVDPARDQWVLLSKVEQDIDDGSRVRRLVIDLSLAHPFSAKFIGSGNENVELFLRIATANCIALILAEDLTGEPPEGVLFHLNYLLRGAILRTLF